MNAPEVTEPETRSHDPSWSALSGMNTATGILVNPRTAEGLSVVLACVGAIAGGIASLPAYIYRRVGKGREIDDGHPVADLIRRGPNAWQTWPDFVEWLVASTLLRGNGLAEMVWDRAGRLVELRPIPWEWVSVQLLPSGRLAYDVTEITSIYGGQGRMRRLLQGEVIHLKDRSDDGLLGRSRLQRAAATVSAGLTIQEFSDAIYRNGANPSGLLSSETKLSPEQNQQLRATFEQGFSGSHKAGRVLILSGGLKWTQTGISPEDAEMLASRRFTTEELARIFNIPPPIVGIWDNSTFTNSETAGRWFAQHTLNGWIRKIETEFNRTVFTQAEPRELSLDLAGFLRGDPESRWRSHEIALKNRVLTRNEVREEEGYNPLPDGDNLDPASPKPADPVVEV
ncbi:phage portal protein [Asticcacaulis sp.]|uniref:phage portal protein n=1 Tax=Asticcacaulis sp. TaxID=1872648 RepID=UPI002629C594|nr:phage portal protein [Asticcacaulis sp.]